MKIKPVSLLVPFLTLSALTFAQPASPPVEPRELIYCADRMTHEEREAYRAKMRAARTLDEKQAIRAAHRAEMQARAAAQSGVTCDPPGRQWHGGRDK
ncbi:MAG: hypothetical protein AB1443_09510 [Pseudomonadota bacterium]